MKKRLLSLALALCILVATAVSLHAVSGLFEYTVSDGYAVITRYVGSVRRVTVPDTLGGVPVREIAIYAFDATNVTEITVPASVEVIRSGAFDRCASLTAIYVSEDNPVYISVDGVLFSRDGCLLRCPQKKQGEYELPAFTTEIESYAFEDCTGLTSVIVPEGVTVIGNYAFGSCTALSNISLPSTLTEIRNGAFYNDTSLTELMIPQNVSYIGLYAFYHCHSLAYLTCVGSNETFATKDNILYTKNMRTLLLCPCGVSGAVEIPAKVDVIAPDAFAGNKKITSVTIPNGVEKISAGAFSDCTSLTDVVIPDSVTEMEEFAFDGCTALKSVKLSYRLTEIAFAAFTDCTSLEAVTIPDSVEKIANYAFNNCKSLKTATVTAGTHLKIIGRFCFQRCTSLQAFAIPEGVTEVGMYAFYGCTSLTGMCTPTTVTVIGSYSFVGCTNLEYLAIMKQTTGFGYPIISSNTTIYCGSSSSPAYAEAVNRGYKYSCKGSLAAYKPTLPKALPDPDPLPDEEDEPVTPSGGEEKTDSDGAETGSDGGEATQSSGAETKSDGIEQTKSDGTEKTQSDGNETSNIPRVLAFAARTEEADYELVFAYLSGRVDTLSAEIMRKADIDRDGVITLADVIGLYQEEN